jgi:hypothetical protein
VQPAEEIAGHHQEGEERLVPRILLAVVAARVAGLRRESGTAPLRAGIVRVLVRQVQVLVARDRMRDEQVVRLVAVDRRLQHRRDRERVDDRRDDRGVIHRPAHLPARRVEERERRDLDRSDGDASEIRIESGNAPPEDPGEEPRDRVHDKVREERPAAEDEQRQDEQRDERRDDHSNPSTCSAAPAGSEASPVTRIVRAPRGSATRPEPSTHAA